MNQQLMTAAEVADFLKISVDTLANWRYLGRGPAYVRQGRVVRYSPESLSVWIGTHEVATSA